MWTLSSERLADGRGLRVAIEFDSAPISFAEVLFRWQHDAEFRTVFITQ